MRSYIDGNAIKTNLLKTISKIDNDKKTNPILQNLDFGSVLIQVAEDLNLRGDDQNEQLLLAVFYDLFRSGHLSWGLNLSNPNPPFFHVTERGRAILRNLSRDPTNPDGYMKYLNETCKLNKVSHSYLDEALQAFNTNLYKSAAVMMGCAAESIIVELANYLNSKIVNSSKKLTDWKTKNMLIAIKSELDKHKNNMPEDLGVKYEAYWPSFNEQIRRTRNDAGHPQNIEFFTFDDVHAALLIFPELAKLVVQLKQFISKNDFK